MSPFFLVVVVVVVVVVAAVVVVDLLSAVDLCIALHHAGPPELWRI